MCLEQHRSLYDRQSKKTNQVLPFGRDLEAETTLQTDSKKGVASLTGVSAIYECMLLSSEDAAVQFRMTKNQKPNVAGVEINIDRSNHLTLNTYLSSIPLARREPDSPYFPKNGIKLCARVYEKTSFGPTTSI